MMLLTVSVMADRTGRLYGHKVEPDEIIVAAADTSHDAQLDRAVAWLKTQPSGGS